MELNEFQKLTLSINQVIQGYLFKDGLIDDVPELLRTIAEDYEEKIEKYYEEELLKDENNL
jgi:hypothetical protein